jgi:pyridoxine kinase
MGIQVCPVPTAILSTHTGGFENMVFHDLTDYITPCFSHYKSIGVTFDAVYSGFLASAEQICGCLEFFRGFENALKVVDPVMGDNGKPYKTYTPQLCRRMGELVRVADIITPNVTEAAILLGEEYSHTLTREVAQSWLTRLCEFSKIAVITGVVIDDRVCNIAMERDVGVVSVGYEHIPVHYPGTGDIFASVLTGSVLNGCDLQSAVKKATDFARKSVAVTHESGGEPRNGVMFERLLGDLIF